MLDVVENNVRWCDLVCVACGVPTATRESLWFALERSPPLYPDAVTLAPDVGGDTVARAVVPGSGCSVKDSFAALDLRTHGFEVLFDARWIYRRPLDAARSVEPGWMVVESRAGLDLWLEAAGTR